MNQLLLEEKKENIQECKLAIRKKRNMLLKNF